MWQHYSWNSSFECHIATSIGCKGNKHSWKKQTSLILFCSSGAILTHGFTCCVILTQQNFCFHSLSECSICVWELWLSAFQAHHTVNLDHNSPTALDKGSNCSCVTWLPQWDYGIGQTSDQRYGDTHEEVLGWRRYNPTMMKTRTKWMILYIKQIQYVTQ